MKIPKSAQKDAKQCFRDCLVNGRLDENRVRQIVQYIITTKPRDFLAILTHFQRLVKLEMNRYTATIESAVAIPETVQGQLRKNLESRYGAELHYNFHLNPNLIGGMRVRIGSDVFDGSIQARLASLQEGFK
jgi:F-type H+-transporting ATPase subunit delta